MKSKTATSAWIRNYKARFLLGSTATIASAKIVLCNLIAAHFVDPHINDVEIEYATLGSLLGRSRSSKVFTQSFGLAHHHQVLYAVTHAIQQFKFCARQWLTQYGNPSITYSSFCLRLQQLASVVRHLYCGCSAVLVDPQGMSKIF